MCGWALPSRRGGVPVGVVTSYACHPVVLGPDNHRFTRDYPGYLLDAVEERWPGCIALFLSGCSGQVNSGHLASASLTGEPTASRTFEVAQDLGERLAGAALAAIERGARPVRATPLRVAHARVRLPLGPPLSDPAADLATWRAELASLGTADADRRAILRALVTWAERIAGAPAADVEVEVACWGLGELALAWFPGEVFVEHGLELKADDGRGTLVTVANALDAPGYLPHASAYPAGGYEVAEAFRFYGRPGPYRPEAGEAVGAAMRALLQEVRA